MNFKKACCILLFITSVVLGGCGTVAYQRECDWCDDASKAQQQKDVKECNALAIQMFPDKSRTYKTGRIVTRHGTTSCYKTKRGDTTCSKGNDYTYEEETTEDVTDYTAREKYFKECTDVKAKNYTAKNVVSKQPANQGLSTDELEYKWDIKTSPDDIKFEWVKIKDDIYVSMNSKSIQINGDRRVVWMLQDKEVPKNIKVLSVVMQLEIDCALKKMRPLVLYMFPKSMGSGEIIGKFIIPNESPGGAWQNMQMENTANCHSIK